MKSNVLLIYGVFFLLVAGGKAQAKPKYLRSNAWVQNDVLLVADLHTHSKFSDGSLSPGELVEASVREGCDVVALTDHSDFTKTVTTATQDYFSELDQLRRQYPELVLIGGIEWNIPPYQGREHVNILVGQEIEAFVLSYFREQFDSVRDTTAYGGNNVDAAMALEWLSRQLTAPNQAVLFYNHPSRKVTKIEESGADLKQWRSINGLMIGFEGAPGHQHTDKTGAYKQHFHTEDRWDPVASITGGVWDELLDQGEDVWAALANSDFHNESLDYLPCNFSRTHIQVPEKSISGVLQGLRAGSFWADHGRILNQLEFTVSTPGLDVAATPGEIIQVEQDASLLVGLHIERGPGGENIPLSAELISNCANGIPRLLGKKLIAANRNTTSWKIEQLNTGKDGKSCYLRGRVGKQNKQEADLLAYTNPVRVMLYQPGWLGGLKQALQSPQDGLQTKAVNGAGFGDRVKRDVQNQGIGEDLDMSLVILIVIALCVLLILIIVALIFFKKSRLATLENNASGLAESMRYDSKISLCTLLFDQPSSALTVVFGKRNTKISFAQITGYEVWVNTECVLKIDRSDACIFDVQAGEKLRSRLYDLEMEQIQDGEAREIELKIFCVQEAEINSVIVNFYCREGGQRLSSYSYKRSVDDVVFWCGLLEAAIRPEVNEKGQLLTDNNVDQGDVSIEPLDSLEPDAKNQPEILHAPEGHVDLVGDLTKLGDLKAKGLLSEQEFQQAKNKIINS